MMSGWTRICALLLGGLPLLHGASVTLYPVADASLAQAFPSNNLGAQLFLTAGTTQTYLTNRALLRFDPAAQIPAGSKIISAQLVVVVTAQPSDGYTPTGFGLYRMRTNWVEGTKSGYPPALGSAAGTNETCWAARLAHVQPWTAAGGATTNDFAPAPSTQEYIYGKADSPYTFRTSAAAVADLQDWLDRPAENFGWMLKPLDEAANFTARRFAAREDADQAPALQVVYLVPPIMTMVQTNQTFGISFTALPGQSYTIESATNAAGPWAQVITVNPPPESTNVVHEETIGGARKYFRVKSF